MQLRARIAAATDLDRSMLLVSGRPARPKEVHDEEYGREDKENVNKEACDVKRDEGKDPYKYKHQSKSEKDEAHLSPPTFMLTR
jgi:hypothetical protein